MRLTLRGWITVAVVVVGIANAIAYGPRALDTVIVPVAVGLVVDAVQVWRVSPPHTEHVAPDDDFPGKTHAVSFDVDIDRPSPATAPDVLSPGLDGDTAVDSVVGDGRTGYEVTYRGCGPATLGPATVVARDILDLLLESSTVSGATEMLVFPRVRSPGAAARRDLSTLADAGRTNERARFDRLREYVPGDPLRDIRWKSSAKSGDLIVKACDDRVTVGTVRISAGATDGHEDIAAKTAATFCCAPLDAGIPVHLISPAGVVEATPGDRRRALVYLPRLHSGSVPDETAEVVVSGDAGKARVALGGRETTFDRLHVERDAVGRSNRNPTSRIGARRPDSGVPA